MSRPFGPVLRAEVAARLSRFDRVAAPEGPLARAAVAATIVPGDDGEACFVITRRADRPGRHSGQWALPGGRTDAGETAAEAALRELSEEVGLSVPPDSVLGLLDDYETRSGFVITPVVVWAEAAAELRPDPREVASVHRVPLASLEAEGVPRLWSIPESRRPVIGVPLAELGTVIHAPTAAVLFQLREVALGGRATRVSGYEQPVFAWK